MWDGPGPRGRPPFRGDHRGEMFWGRDRPMPDYRDGMNMHHMGPRPFAVPLMDQRRMDAFPMRGHDMDPRDFRGRDPSREFLIPGEGPDFHPRRHVESSLRDEILDPPGFRGPGRDFGGRDMPPWEPNDRFLDMRDREMFHNMPRFDRPDIDGRRGFPMDRMVQDGGFRDMPDRHPGDIGDANRYEMDLPPHEKRLDINRRGGPPFNPRGRFESDMDFRNQPGAPVDIRGRERSPLRFGPGEFSPEERERTDMPPDVVGRRPQFRGPGGTAGSRDYPETSGSPIMDYWGGEEMTLAEEWKNRQKSKKPYAGQDLEPAPSFPLALSRPKEKDAKFIQNKTSCDSLPPYFEDPKKPSHEIKEPNDPFGEINDIPSEQIPFRKKLQEDDDYQRKSTVEGRDQDYRDIDYRTASRRVYDYHHEELPPSEIFLKDPPPVIPSKFTDSGSQDRDYRNASVKEKVSNIVSISGIPKTDSVDQILGAFAVRDGMPIQGIDIRNVVPGYSYDMAFVEFLNLEDAVHFMESNKVAHPRHSKTAVSPIWIARGSEGTQ